MANKLYKEENIQAIGNAIRTKGGTTALLKVGDMAQAIADIPEPTGTEEIDENGTYNIASKKYVAVNVPQTGIEPQGVFNVSQNGTYNVRNYEYVIVQVGGTPIEPMHRDLVPIPDAYNTGLSDASACIKHLSDTDTSLNGIPLRRMSENNLVFDWNAYITKSLEGEHVIENYDFTEGATLGYTNGDKYVGSGVIIHFKNCKFSSAGFGGRKIDTKQTYFTHCEFTNGVALDYGKADNCYIVTSSGTDGAQATGNIEISNTYIKVIDSYSDVAGTNHMDGFQGLSGDNLHLDNVRIEIPWINFSKHKGTMNSAFYMETNAEHSSLTDSIIAGGGNNMMDCYNSCVVEDCLLQRNSFYTGKKTLADCVNTKITDALYVSSVLNNGDNIIVYATNDTFTPRVLQVKTNKGDTTFNIGQYWNRTDYAVDTKTFSDYPIDVPCQISASGVDYVICYDVTDAENPVRVRFVNYTVNPVYA